ncbi:hypothetical protein ACP8Y2_24315 [Herpetosiphon llansteffanensis]
MMVTKQPVLPEEFSQMALAHFRLTNADRTTRGQRIIQGATNLEYRWALEPTSQPENPRYVVTVQLQHWDAIRPEIYLIEWINGILELNEIKELPAKIAWSRWIVVPGTLG